MKKLLSTLFACFMATTSSYAQDCCYSVCGTDCFGFDAVLAYDIGDGFRQDNLKWKAYPLSSPGTVQSEKWNTLQMAVVETNAQFLACEHYLFKFDFDYGYFTKGGKQKVTSFNQSSQTLLYNNQARTRGHVYDLSMAAGYQFNFFCYRYAFAPIGGYSTHFQKLKNNDYSDEINSRDCFYVKNSYKFRWRGPTLGFFTAYQINCDWQVSFVYNYHWLRYRGKVQENFNVGALPGHLKSNKVFGNEYKLTTTYQICPNWILALNLDYKIFQSNHGRYETDLGVTGQDKSALRSLKWTSTTATLDLGYVF